MIEPRSTLLHVHRRNVSSNAEADEGLLRHVFVDEPERPIHPALEYELFVDNEDEDEEEHNVNSSCRNLFDEKRDDDLRYTPEESPPQETRKSTFRRIKLWLSFLLLLVSGAGTVVLMKLKSIPMYNYSNFLNLFCHLIYIPLCFCFYSFSHWNKSTAPITRTSKRPFMIMGALDCLASTLQLFASMYVPGNLLVLLPQAVIPCSMALSYSLLGERYHGRQYCGAVVVLLGLIVVLTPVLTFEHAPDFYCEAMDSDNDCTVCQTETTIQSCLSHVQPIGDEGDQGHVQNICQWLPYQQATKQEEELTLGWSLLLLSSAIPMTLSAMYKQSYVTELDPVYLNGWISIFQFMFALVVAVPAAWMTHVAPFDVPRNMWDGFLCFLGQGTIDSGCHPDECSSHTPILVGSYLVFATLYSTSILCVLKYGSTSTLFMAQTILVPLGNLAFSLPLFHNSTHSPLYTSDVMGLIVILSGLILYRFWGENDETSSDEPSHGTHHPWVQQVIQQVERQQTPSPWYLDMVEHLRTQVQTGDTPWLNDLLRHMREPLLQEEGAE